MVGTPWSSLLVLLLSTFCFESPIQHTYSTASSLYISSFTALSVSGASVLDHLEAPWRKLVSAPIQFFAACNIPWLDTNFHVAPLALLNDGMSSCYYDYYSGLTMCFAYTEERTASDIHAHTYDDQLSFSYIHQTCSSSTGHLTLLYNVGKRGRVQSLRFMTAMDTGQHLDQLYAAKPIAFVLEPGRDTGNWRSELSCTNYAVTFSVGFFQNFPAHIA